VKVGVLGLGSIGSRHVRNLKAMGHEVVGYDPQVTRMWEVNGDGARHARTADIWNCDAVIIASPSSTHVPHLVDALAHDRHVLVEKPISTTPFAASVLQAAADKGLVVMTGYNLRFLPCVIAAKQWLTEGRIGAPIWAQFTVAQRSDKPDYLRDGVLLNWASHEIDLAMHLLSRAKVLCAALQHNIMVDLVMLHDGGCRTTVHADYLTRPHLRYARIVGTDGEIRMNIEENYALMETPAGATVSGPPGPAFDQCYVDELRSFIATIEGKPPGPGATGFDGRRVLELCLEAEDIAV
jgi:predicted dehydrogenase